MDVANSVSIFNNQIIGIFQIESEILKVLTKYLMRLLLFQC